LVQPVAYPHNTLGKLWVVVKKSVIQEPLGYPNEIITTRIEGGLLRTGTAKC